MEEAKTQNDQRQKQHKKERKTIMKKIIAVTLMICMCVCMMAGCGQKAATPAQTGAAAATATESVPEKGKAPVKIGVAIASYNSTAMQAMGETFEKTAKELGIDCVVSNADNDLERQIDQVQDLVMQGCNAIIVNAVDADGIIPAVEEARAQGIKVIAVDRLINTELDYSISTDNYAAGVAAGEYFVEVAAGEECEILLLTATPSNTAIRDRQAGFKDTVTKYSNMKIVSEPFVEVSAELVYNGIIDGFKAHPNIRFIYAAGDAFLPAMQSALIELGMQLPIDDPRHVYLSSCDGEKNALESVDNGTSDQCVCQLFTDLAVKALNVAVDLCNGKTPEKAVEEYPVLSYTRETKDSIPVEQLWGLR